jgi:beta-lactamase regulating signal transducer with metallopeptidase domain
MNALGQLLETSFTSRLCLALLHSLWQIGLLAMVMWIIDRLASAHAVEFRYRLHVVALLLAIAALPLTFFLVDGSTTAAISIVATTHELVVPAEATPTGTGVGAEMEVSAPAALPSVGSARGTSQDAPPDRSLASGSETVAPTTAAIPVALARWIVALYALGVLLMLARLLRGMWLGQRMVARAQLLTDGVLVAASRGIAERWNVKLLPRLAVSDALAMPCVTGLLRPTIIFPVAALSGMSPAELELILLHELAHVRRHDLWMHLLQRVAEAVLFFNPGLWYLSRRLSVLREYCCDELACGFAAASAEPIRLQYAAALIHSAELQLAKTGRVSSAALAEIGALAAAGSSPSELRRRVARLLDEPLREPLFLSRSGVASCAAVMLVLIVAPALVYSDGQEPADGNQQATSSAGERRITESDAPAEQPDRFTRTLNSGAVVRVLGVGTRNETPARWWTPSGTPVEGAPFRVLDNDQYTFPEIAREVVFAIDNLPAGATVRRDTNPPSKNWGGGRVADATGQKLDTHYGRIFSLAKDTQAFSLSVGVAAGEWKRMRDVEIKEPVRIRQDRLITVPVLSKLQQLDTRLILIGADGLPRQAIGWSRGDLTPEGQRTEYQFRLTAGDEIVRFEFQARDFEWTTFEGLPVHSNPDGEGTPKPAPRTAIEIAGIGTTPSAKLQLWWDSDANLLKEVQFHVRGGSVSPRTGMTAREVVFKLPDLPADANVRYHIDSSGSSAKGEVIAPDGSLLPHHFSEVFLIDSTAESFNLRVGVSTDKWDTVYTGDTHPQSQGSIDRKGIVLSGVFTKDGATSIVVSHNWLDRDSRLLAIDKEGKRHSPTGFSQLTAADTVNQSIYEYKNLAEADVESFEFQVREFKWTTLENLPVQPKIE